MVGGRQSIPEMGQWSERLGEHGAPVVWLDRNDEGRPRYTPNLTRCHYREERTVACAVRFLAENGHRAVLYLYAPEVDWQVRRADVLRAEATKCEPQLEIRSKALFMPEIYRYPFRSGILGQLESIYPNSQGNVRAAFDFMIEHTETLAREFQEFRDERWAESRFGGFCAFTAANPSKLPSVDPVLLTHAGKLWGILALWPLLQDRTITAIVCPNDKMGASHHLNALAATGMRAPRDISIISFDNRYGEAFLPLTTVDHGFGYLGYQAFHLIMKDIQLAARPGGDIAARPKVIDRGSVGIPDLKIVFPERR